MGRNAGGDGEAEDPAADDGVQHLLAGVGHRPARHELLQLREGDHRACEGDAADDHSEEDLDDLVDGQLVGVRLVEFRQSDEGGGAASDTVEGRHHLRYRRHLDEASGGKAQYDPDGDGRCHQREA